MARADEAGVTDAGPEGRVMLTLPPRTYVVVDRGSKVVGLVLVGTGLADAVGSLSPLLALVGLVVGVATVFVGVDESADGRADDDVDPQPE